MKGFKQYQRFKDTGSLTPKQAILARCYVCNGEAEGGEDCLGVSCPLYQYMPYQKGRIKKQMTPEALENLRKAIEFLGRKRPPNKTLWSNGWVTTG